MARESTPARRSPKKLLTPTEREAMQFAAYAETYNACQTLRDIMAFAKNSLTAPLVAKSHTTLSEQTIAAANSGQHTQAVAIYYEVMQPKWQQLLKSGAMPRAVAHPMKLDIHKLFIVYAIAATCVNAFEQAIWESRAARCTI